MEHRKIILDLCGGTGSWSSPYTKHEEYDVRIITLPSFDVMMYTPPANVYGILAAPPCTHFSSSGAWTWKEKDKNGATLEDLRIVTHCLRIILESRPVGFWALENPVGRLYKWLGKPRAYFDPCDYGDPWTKKTCLWGDFIMPAKKRITPTMGSVIEKYGGASIKTKTVRSITPPGFARAFFEANR